MMASQGSEVSLASAAVQFRLATIWQARGQTERAIAGYEEAINLRSDYLPAYLELGQLLARQGRVEAAAAVYRRGLAVQPGQAELQARLTELTSREESVQPDNQPGLRSADTFPNPLHIALYTDCSGIYGAEQWNHALALALAADGYRVTLVQPRAAHGLVDAQVQAGIAHVWLAEDNLYDPSRPARALTDDAEPRHILDQLRPDLLLFSDGAPMSSLAAKEVARDLGLPYLVVVHCVTEAWAEAYRPYVARLPEVYRHAQAVVCVSRANLRLLHDRFGLPPDQGIVILNGRSARFFAPPDPAARRLREDWRIPAQAVVVCTVGSLERRKGYPYLLQAAARLRQSRVWPALQFVWVGRGSLEGRLRAAVEGLGVSDRVHFLGERADIVDILDAADIFALPSEYEGMPLSVMEAMARGKPVVATDVSGVAEELGDTGCLLPDPNLGPAATVAGLVQTLETWAGDAGLRQSIGAQCRERAARLFTEDRMLAEYRALLQRVRPSVVTG